MRLELQIPAVLRHDPDEVLRDSVDNRRLDLQGDLELGSDNPDQVRIQTHIFERSILVITGLKGLFGRKPVAPLTAAEQRVCNFSCKV